MSQLYSACHTPLTPRPNPSTNAELSTEAELKAACESAMPVLSLLHDYQRRRIMSQWFYLLPAEAVEGRRGRARPGSRAGPDARGVLQESDDGNGAEPQFGERPSTGAEDLPAVLDDEAAELRRLLAEQAAPFHAASAWMGAAAGYVFKLGEAGLGYYADTPVEAAPLYTPTLVRGLSAFQEAVDRTAPSPMVMV